MRRFFLILLLITAVLPGCRHEPLPSGGSGEAHEIGIYITCPGMPDTRAAQGDAPAKQEEYKVHTLQVWIFTNDESHEPLYYLSLSGEYELPEPGRTRRYAIPVGSEFARRNPLPAIDVFALANAASVGCTLGETSDWNDVSDALFNGDDWFGVREPVHTVDPEKGLPMTGNRRGMTLSSSEDGFVLNADQTVELIRAVSKIRYVFCRMKDDDDPNGEKVSIQSITLNGGQLPIAEYLFTTTAPYRIGTEYESRTVMTPGPAVIAPNAAPEKLVYAGQNATTYDKLLDDAVEDGVLTEGGTFYFRESDKALTGTVSFTSDGVERTRVFSMSAPGDFVRNHSWTLYGYFISGRKLEISINAIPWDYSHYHVDFSQGSVIATKLEIDENTATVRYNATEGYNDVFFNLNNPAKGVFNITSPLNGKVMINPIGDANAFIVEPDVKDINPDVNGGNIEVSVRPNPAFQANNEEEYSITLSFFVQTIDGREIDANSEINRENYRFVR